VQILDANILRIKAGDLAGHFKFPPQLLGITANITNYHDAVECSQELKRVYPGVPVIFGGPYSTSLANEILEKIHSIDAIVMGEGEVTLVEIAKAVDGQGGFLNIKGVMHKCRGEIVDNGPRELIADLDLTPPPAYDLLPDLKKYRTRCRAWPVGYVITSRGCPSKCIFCNRNIFGNSWRPHSAERVIAEIESLAKNYGAKQIDILDDNFTFDLDRAAKILDFLSGLPSKLCINLQNGVRIDRVNEEMLLKMRQAGVFKIAFGVETANAGIQKNVRKPVDLEKAVAVNKMARSLGMITYAFFMVGLPGDSPATMEETVEFAVRMNPHFAIFSICLPFPGTELFELVSKEGEFLADLKNGVDRGYLGQKIFFRIGSMDPREVSFYFNRAYQRFYLRPAKLADILSSIRSFGELKWLGRELVSALNVYTMNGRNQECFHSH
jgi:anaerobic magnesium-protoporphyrin IX monomethyl ester cyclase